MLDFLQSSEVIVLGLVFAAFGVAALLLYTLGRFFESKDDFAETRELMKHLLMAAPLLAVVGYWAMRSPDGFDHWAPVALGGFFWAIAVWILWTSLRFMRRRRAMKKARADVLLMLTEDEHARVRNDIGIAYVMLAAPVVATWLDIEPTVWGGAMASVLAMYPKARQAVRAKPAAAPRRPSGRPASSSPSPRDRSSTSAPPPPSAPSTSSAPAPTPSASPTASWMKPSTSSRRQRGPTPPR